MPVSDSQNKRQLAPWIFGLVCLAITYPALQWLTEQPMLALSVAIITSFATYMVCRLIQLRGRLTVAMAVIGLPLLTAMSFTAFREVTPFLARQRSYDELRSAGIGFWGREPEKMGEWIQDIHGNILPIWLADRIGSDCMKELYSISGHLDDLQKIHYRELDTSSLRNLTLHWDDTELDLSPDFVSWVRGLQLDGIRVTHRLSPGDDVEAILAASTDFIADQVAEQSWTPGGTGWKVSFEVEGPVVLSAQDLKSLAELPDESRLTLSGVKLEADAVSLLADQRFDSIWLRKVQLPDMSDATPGDAQAKQREIRVLEGNLSFDEIRHLVRVFHCQSLSGPSDASDEEVESLGWGETLQEISLWEVGSRRNRRFSRPKQ